MSCHAKSENVIGETISIHRILPVDENSMILFGHEKVKTNVTF